MREVQSAVLGALVRTKRFLETNEETFAAINGTIRDRIDGTIATLSELEIERAAVVRDGRDAGTRQRELRIVLRRGHMAAIVAAAVSVDGARELRTLKLPSPDAPLAVELLAAEAMAVAAAPLAETLMKAGLGSAFICDLRTAMAAVVQSASTREDLAERRVRTTRSIHDAEQSGRLLLRLVSAMVVASVRGDRGMLDEWKAVKRIAPAAQAASPEFAVDDFGDESAAAGRLALHIVA
jgi:hypothetical protein